MKHSLEEFTLDRPQNDLDPGNYILLRYTDPIFENCSTTSCARPTTA